MAIRLKSKYLYALVLTIALCMLGVSTLSAFDIAKNKEYISKDSYFKSYSYKTDLVNYFQNIQLLITNFKDYSQKSEDEKLLELKKVNVTADENQLKVALQKNNMRYNEIKAKVDSERVLRYYVKDNKSKKVFSNIEDALSVDDYIEKEGLHVDKFPTALSNNDYLQAINLWFQRNNFEGSFIFIKPESGFSQMEENYNYYSAIRERVIKEVFICIVSLLIEVGLLIFIKLKFKTESHDRNAIKNLYKKIPLDIRVFIFCVYAIIMLTYLSQVNFFYAPLELKHFLKLSVVGLYMFYLTVSIGSALRLTQNKEEFTTQFQRSISYQMWLLWRESLKDKETMFREVSLYAFTALFGMFIVIALVSISGHSILFLIAFIYIVVYLLLVPIYILKRVVTLNRIIEGTDAIASGNLDYVMKDRGDSNYIRVAKNINNMKDSFKKSVESQLRSERLKTELITNVSHDLKTPLTNIISYVNLLKKGNLSEEQSKKFIEVLEQKSQRLKILIEDLFEASKVSSGAVELTIEKVDIAALLRQALGEFDEKITNSLLTFKTKIPAQEVYLNLDGKRTWRVFENLISNALKYSQPGSRVYIDLIEKVTTVEVIIKNMSSYEMDFDVDEIFERFKRGDKARSTEGSGLGLSIAKSIVELQGGHMKIVLDGDLFKVSIEFKK